MHILFFMFVVISIIKKDSCSLLSRLKNRYEYLPQENNVELITEDLYDFEFTNILSTVKSSSLNSLNEMNPAEEDFYHISQSNILNTSELNRKRTDAFSSPNNMYDGILPASEFFFLSRPTIRTSSSSKLRKTWPTYFPRKMLQPRKLVVETGKLITTQSNATSKIAESTPPHDETTLTPVSTPNNPTPSTSSNSTNTPTPASTPINPTPSTSSNSTNTPTPADPENISRTLTPLNSGQNSMSINTNISDITPTPTTSMRKPNVTISYCYRCGLNESRIPSAYCYNTFEGGDRSHGGLRHLFKIKCIRNEREREEKKVAYGPMYRKGCFKRFLDVGVEYNERGCRTEVPTRGKSFASKRLASMEHLLKHVDDGCVFSPHASITPFSRAISLFVRYHVCVCSQKYCNRADTTKQNLNESYILIIYTMIKYFCY